MIFQDPMTSLNPVCKVGMADQRAVRAARGVGERARATAPCELLDAVGIPDADAGSTTIRTSSPAACASA